MQHAASVMGDRGRVPRDAFRGRLARTAGMSIGEDGVMKSQSRRDFLTATAAMAVSAAIAGVARTHLARAQTPGSGAGAEWDYRTAKELVAALQGRKISALELAEHVIASDRRPLS